MTSDRPTAEIVEDLRLTVDALPEGYYAHTAVVDAIKRLEELDRGVKACEAIHQP